MDVTEVLKLLGAFLGVIIGSITIGKFLYNRGRKSVELENVDENQDAALVKQAAKIKKLDGQLEGIESQLSRILAMEDIVQSLGDQDTIEYAQLENQVRDLKKANEVVISEWAIMTRTITDMVAMFNQTQSSATDTTRRELAEVRGLNATNSDHISSLFDKYNDLKDRFHKFIAQDETLTEAAKTMIHKELENWTKE